MKAIGFGATAAVLSVALVTASANAQTADAVLSSSMKQQAASAQVQQQGINFANTAPAGAPRYVWKEGYERGRWRSGWVTTK